MGMELCSPIHSEGNIERDVHAHGNVNNEKGCDHIPRFEPIHYLDSRD
jgi:hypothetical protein